MTNHINRVHKLKELSSCNQCSYQTKYKANLQLHKAIHSNVKPAFYCDTCAFETHGLDNLKRHKKTVHGPSKRTLKQCQVCDRTFTTNLLLEKHEQTHRPENQNHICSVCNSKFVAKSTLKTHIKTIHPLDFWKMEFKNIL